MSVYSFAVCLQGNFQKFGRLLFFLNFTNLFIVLLGRNSSVLLILSFWTSDPFWFSYFVIPAETSYCFAEIISDIEKLFYFTLLRIFIITILKSLSLSCNICCILDSDNSFAFPCEYVLFFGSSRMEKFQIISYILNIMNAM